MFGNSKKRYQEAREYIHSFSNDVQNLIERFDDYGDKSLVELYANLFFAHLAQDTVNIKHIRPYLGKAIIDQMRFMHIDAQHIQKRLDFIYMYWTVLETTEKDLRKAKTPALIDKLIEGTAFFPGDTNYLQTDALDYFKVHTYNFIRKHNLIKYEEYLPAAEKEPVLSDIQQTIRLQTADGKEVTFHLMDIITIYGVSYACLLEEGDSQLTILKMDVQDDSTVIYSSDVDENTLIAVYTAFKQKNS